MKGTFLVLDGGDGAGKTTVLNFLRQHYGPDLCLCTREPGGSERAELIRELILHDAMADAPAETKFALFWAARYDHLQHTVIPALEAGKIVVSDRLDSATWAYQIHGEGQRGLVELFHQLRAHCMQRVDPHYVILDVNPEESQKRRGARPEDENHFDRRKQEFHAAVRSGMLTFGRDLGIPDTHFRVIDASVSAENVQQAVLEYVEEIRART